MNKPSELYLHLSSISNFILFKATKRSASPIEEDEDETIRRKYLKFLQDNNFTHDNIDRVMKPKSKKSGENKVPKDKKPGEKKVPKDKKPKKPITPGAAGCLKKPLARVTGFTLKTEDTVNTVRIIKTQNLLKIQHI